MSKISVSLEIEVQVNCLYGFLANQFLNLKQNSKDKHWQSTKQSARTDRKTKNNFLKSLYQILRRLILLKELFEAFLWMLQKICENTRNLISM